MQTFATWHGWTEKANGTSLIGYVNISYKELVLKLGKPNEGDGYKTDAEWLLEFDDGTIATIYNYKDGYNYLGKREGTAKTKLTEWHIGGYDEKAVHHVHELLGIS